MEYLKNTHDLRLPEWGPYTKKYMGISHIPDEKNGLRFDLSIVPGLYRRKVEVPNVLWESGYHPWEASPDLSYFCHRHELEWKDQVYCDISFSEIDQNSRLIRCECVNATSRNQSMALHYMASMNFPTVRPYAPQILEPCVLNLPEGALWVDALAYEKLEYARPRPTDSLGTDGFWRAEIRDSGFTNGNGIGAGFGKDAGDCVIYKIKVSHEIPKGMLLFRYRLQYTGKAVFKLEGIVESSVEFEPGEDFQIKEIDVGNITPGEYELVMTSQGEAGLEMDGIALLPREDCKKIRFERKKWTFVPRIMPGPVPNSLILEYEDVEGCYGILWEYEPYEIREFYCDELDRFMRFTTHHHTTSKFRLNEDGHFTNIFLRPVEMEKNSSKVLYGMVCYGSRKAVEDSINTFVQKKYSPEKKYIAAKAKSVKFNISPAGEKYRFSQERMAATTLTNIVYPVYTRKAYIKHSTPGRWWDCLYTWDSGFIGLGLLELDIERAVDCLNAYVTEPGDDQAAFIHHGSPVPVQFYLFLELCNRTQSKKLLEFFYPRLQQYHRFLCGRLGSSTTRQLKSNFIKTWDYFYNSGGWDDYPPQVHVHENRLENTVAPIINTAHCIRTAKILKMAAEALGKFEDTREYDEDIFILSEAIQEHSWDEESGYFGYVCHDGNGNPQGILRHESGSNYNMGLDGAYPLVAGMCSKHQEEKLLAHFRSEQELFSSAGVSAVDRSAPYYKEDGYWNGTVWMSHQWFFWKAMLDLGEGELADAIARTGLEVWKKEVDASYNCFEHFVIDSGRGAGWHHFSGLSTPVLSWFSAYYRPGTLTCGFDIWVEEKRFSSEHDRVEAKLKFYGVKGRRIQVLACMNPGFRYRVIFEREKAAFKEVLPGVLQISIIFNGSEGKLTISAIEDFEDKKERV